MFSKFKEIRFAILSELLLFGSGRYASFVLGDAVKWILEAILFNYLHYMYYMYYL
jgi:hypothetical protein